MSEAVSLPAPKWWHIPEYMICLCMVVFAGAGIVFWHWPDARGDLIPLVPYVLALSLIGFGLIRTNSYTSPNRRISKYAAFYAGIYFGLFMVAIQMKPDQGWVFFAILVFANGVWFGGMTYLISKPRRYKYDWSQIYSDPISPHGPSFAAKRLKYWPFVTLAAILAILVLTRNPAWAILIGAACLAFTLPAYTRNPATARPVLARLLNLLAVCLIFIAAASLILKGY